MFQAIIERQDGIVTVRSFVNLRARGILAAWRAAQRLVGNGETLREVYEVQAS